MKVIELSEEQIYDYAICPLRYDSRYNLKIATQNHPSFKSLLDRVANSFLLNLMNNKVLSTSELKKKWDVTCEGYKDIIDQNGCISGMGLLMQMYLWAEEQELCVSDLKSPFLHRIAGSNPPVNIRGETAEALIVKDRKSYELLVIDFSPRYPDQALIDMKTKYTLDWAVYKNFLPDMKNLGIRIHHVKKNKDWYTFRTEESMQRMNASFRNIATCINEKLFYPRENIMCAACDMKLYCKAWRG